MTTTTETVLSTPIVRKPAEENGEKPQQRSADWENPRVASILSAAAKCFARKGFTATTLAEIGKELGLRKSIVHYYFASKAALSSGSYPGFHEQGLPRGDPCSLTVSSNLDGIGLPRSSLS